MSNIIEQEWLNLIIEAINSRADNTELYHLQRFYSCSGTDDLTLSTPDNYGFRLKEYKTGTPITFIAPNENGGAMTVDVDGVGKADLCDTSGKELRKGSIKAGWAYTFVYDGTKFIQSGGGSGGSGTQTVITQDHSLTLNKLVPLHFDKDLLKYVPADLSNNKPADQIGIASDTSSIAIGRQMRIPMPSGDSYKAGDCLYTSQSIPGGITVSQPDALKQTLGKIELENGELMAAIDVDTAFDIEESNVGALLKRGEWDGSAGILPTPSLDNEYWLIVGSGGKLLGGENEVIVGVGDFLVCDTNGWNVIPAIKLKEYLGYEEGNTNSLMDVLNQLFTFAGNGKQAIVDALIGKGTDVGIDDTFQKLADEITALPEKTILDINIKDENDSVLPKRSNLQFINATAVDDPDNDTTVITLLGADFVPV